MKPYYEHGGISIYHADCREVLPVLFGPNPRCADCEFLRSEHDGSGEDYRLMIERGMCGNFALEQCDLLLTDPPYGIYDCGGKWGKKAELQWDRQPAGNIQELLAIGLEQVIWGGNYFALPPSRGWLVWWKRDSVPSTADVELAWTSKDMNSKLIDHPIAATNGERIGHPTQKPLRVMRWCLSFFPESESVIDPYCGSGTTLLAAKQLGKSAMGIEIEEKYCEIAAKRLSQEVFQFGSLGCESGNH